MYWKWKQNFARPGVFPGSFLVFLLMNRHHRPLQEFAMRFFELPESGRILDIGCGGGDFLAAMLRHAPEARFYGVDYSPVSVKKSRSYNRAAVQRGQMEVVKGDVSALPFQDAFFDLITASETIYFWPDPAGDVREVARVLKPGGTFVVCCAAADRDAAKKYIDHIRGLSVYSAAELSAFMSGAGLTGIECHADPATGMLCVIGKKPGQREPGSPPPQGNPAGSGRIDPAATELPDRHDGRKSNLFRLAEYAGGYRPFLLLGCLLSGVAAVLALLPYLCIWFVAREALRPGGDADPVVWGWLAVAFAGASTLLYFAALMCTHLAAFRTARNLRSAVLRHAVSLPLGFFTANETGRLRKQIHDNADMTESLIAHQLPDLIGAAVAPAAAVILLLLFDWRMGLACFLPMAAGFLILGRMLGGDNTGFFSRYQQKQEEMSGAAVEYVRGIPVVKTFQQSVYSFRNFHRIILEYCDLAHGYAMSMRTPMTWFTTTLNGFFVLLIPVGLMLVIAGGDGGMAVVPDFLFYVLFAPACAMMVNRIMYCSQAVMQAGEAVRKLDGILEQRPLPEAAEPEIPAGNDICFEHVTFLYEDNELPALSDVSFEVKAGMTVAMVGRSGGGKTTAAMLVPRFRDVSAGAVRIGGGDVRNIPQRELMAKVSFVFQDTRLFKATVRENLRCSRPAASSAQLETAIRAARCEDIIAKLPNGLDSVIGVDGVYLSEGEMQRIALARAMLKDAPIVVLDEATAFADPENEYLIRQAFAELTRGKTVLMIAHRLNSVVKADEILVFDGGRIVERGRHDELLRRNGIYAELWQEYRTSVEWKVGKKVAAC